jgi:hypothetical protein
MTGDAAFRRFLYAPDDPRIAPLRDLDAYAYREHAKGDDFTGELIRGWTPAYFSPFVGVTSDGTVTENLFRRAPARPGESAPTPAMVAAARRVLSVLPEDKRRAVQYEADAPEWQGWANPEFLQHDTGLRLEFEEEPTRRAVLSLLEASLSPSGYELARTLMRINDFLGGLVGLKGVMNEYSYNFALFGSPSEDRPWGWQLFGHHLAMNCLVVGDQMVLTPVFFGAEPTMLDDGPFAGTMVFKERIAAGRRLMQELPAHLRDRARVYDRMVDPAMPVGRVHPGDERHLAGAFQDNRVIPLEGVRVGEMDGTCQSIVIELVADFLAYLPQGPAAARLREIEAHLDDTWFSWIGGWGPGDPFYLRLQSDVVVLELDHHCGVFLSNSEPAEFHIHTVMRTPNGNDYGRALLLDHRRTHEHRPAVPPGPAA